jgi:hypothetical protein
MLDRPSDRGNRRPATGRRRPRLPPAPRGSRARRSEHRDPDRRPGHLAARPNGPRSGPGLPDETGASLTLTFRATPQGPALAAATSQLSSCQDITLTIGGKPQPDLRGAIVPKILQVAALPWTIPSP